MKLLKRIARTLIHCHLRRRRDVARWLVGQVETAGERPPLSTRILYWFLRIVYFGKRFMQDAVAGRGPRRRALAAWRREMDTALWSKLYLWSTRSVTQPVDRYQTHAENNRLFANEAGAMRRQAQDFAYRPLVSILVPVFNAAPRWLERLVRSVEAQTYDRWELVLVDDGSTSSATAGALEAVGERGGQIVVERLGANRGVSAATNRAAELASGELLAFLDHDDELYPDALWYVVQALQHAPQSDLIYTDEELVQEPGGRAVSVFKPDFSPELLSSYNYICHLLVLRKCLFDALGGLRDWTNGAQDYDLVLRASERTARIVHVPRVLYRWHVGEASLSRRRDASGRMHVAGGIVPLTGRVVQEHLDRQGIAAVAEPFGDWVRPRFRPANQGMVSVILCTRDHPWLLWRAVRSIERHTDYPHYEVLIVDNDSRTWLGRLCLRWLARRHRVLHIPNGPEGFSFSRLNNLAASQARGRFLLFLNDDTRVLCPGWLSALVGYAARTGVGAAGAWLRRPDGRNQHSGVILGAMGWGPWHAFMDLPARHHWAHRQYLMVPRNVSAVTGACLLTHRDWFLRLGGFDEERFKVSFNDVDYCLSLREHGLRIAYVPQAELVHYEGCSRGKLARPAELAQFRRRANDVADPYWNPNFSRQYDGFVCSCRRRRRRLENRLPRVLVVAPDEVPKDHWPQALLLFRELSRRGFCSFEQLCAGEPVDAEELARRRVGDFDVVFGQGPGAVWAIEAAHELGIASLWSLPEQWPGLDGRDPAAAGRFLRFLRALELPYQVVFNNPHSMGWAQVGVPRGNFVTLEAIAWNDPTRTIDRAAARRRLRQQLNLADDVPLLLAEVRLGANDGVETILRACDRLRHRGQAFHLVLLGHGSNGCEKKTDGSSIRRTESPLRADGSDSLAGGRQRHLKRWIARLGASASVVIEPSRVLDYYAAADVCIAHATTNLRPLGLLLALAFGLPVVGTEILANSQILYFGATGAKFRPFDARALARALHDLLDAPESLRATGQASRDWLDSRTHPDTLLNDWGELVCEAAELTWGARSGPVSADEAAVEQATAKGGPVPRGAELRYVSLASGGTIR